MRLTVVHDSQGNIEVLGVAPPDSVPVQISTRPGKRMTEIEAPSDVTLDLDSPRLQVEVWDIIEHHRVEFPSVKGTLTRKT